MPNVSRLSRIFALAAIALPIAVIAGSFAYRSFFPTPFDLKFVTDVVFDRYEKYGEPYYRYRLEKDLAKLTKDSENFLNYDDAAVAYDRLGQFDRAMEVLENKKTAMEKASFDRMAWYRYYANR